MHNPYMWLEENPYAIRHHVAQTRFSVDVWASITEDQPHRTLLATILSNRM